MHPGDRSLQAGRDGRAPNNMIEVASAHGTRNSDEVFNYSELNITMSSIMVIGKDEDDDPESWPAVPSCRRTVVAGRGRGSGPCTSRDV